MATIEIPLNAQESQFNFEVILDQQLFTFAFGYNTRLDRWAYDIFTSQGEPVIRGFPVHTDTPTLIRFVNQNLPSGNLVFVNVKNQGVDAGRLDLGVTVRLAYQEATSGD